MSDNGAWMPKAKRKDTFTYSTSQWLNFDKDSYLERTGRPIYAIVFLLPFIALYELGTFLINTETLNQSEVRVVAFVWLQEALKFLNFDGRWAWTAPPLVVFAILLGLQLASRKPWSLSLRDLAPMFIECVLLAIPLIVLSLMCNSHSADPLPESPDQTVMLAVQSQVAGCTTGDSWLPLQQVATIEVPNENSLWPNMVTGLGAGIYEELIFRLVLMVVLMMIFQDALGCSHKHAIIFSIFISAALFSAHHHIVIIHGQIGQTSAFSWAAFSFRTIAGIYFAVLFALRGFGITAGTHALYDILATCLNAFWFAG